VNRSERSVERDRLADVYAGYAEREALQHRWSLDNPGNRWALVVPGAYRAPIDTIFVVYRAGPNRWFPGGLRTRPQYLPYAGSAHHSHEDCSCREHADPVTSNWDRERVAARKHRNLGELGHG
jgi:hypothetical protein